MTIGERFLVLVFSFDFDCSDIFGHQIFEVMRRPSTLNPYFALNRKAEIFRAQVLKTVQNHDHMRLLLSIDHFQRFNLRRYLAQLYQSLDLALLIYTA